MKSVKINEMRIKAWDKRVQPYLERITPDSYVSEQGLRYTREIFLHRADDLFAPSDSDALRRAVISWSLDSNPRYRDLFAKYEEAEDAIDIESYESIDTWLDEYSDKWASFEDVINEELHLATDEEIFKYAITMAYGDFCDEIVEKILNEKLPE